MGLALHPNRDQLEGISDGLADIVGIFSYSFLKLRTASAHLLDMGKGQPYCNPAAFSSQRTIVELDPESESAVSESTMM